MMKASSSSERGQAVVLIMLAIVALLGFTALAVDGSMMYSDRRYSQSGSDASSLAGGGTAIQWMGFKGVTYANFGISGTTCTGATLLSANKGIASAISRAADNGFTIDNNISDNNGVEATCGIQPITGPKVGGGTAVIFNDKYMDIRTTITKQTNTAFLHFVYQGAAENVVTSVTRVRPPQPLAYGYAIVALNPSNCSGNKYGVGLGGSLNMFVEGGGMFSNGCFDIDGGTHPTVKNGAVNYFDPGDHLDNLVFMDKNGNVINSGKPIANLASNAPRLPPSSYDVPVPDCSAAGAHQGSASILYGQSNLSGLYCITGDLSVNNAGESFSGTNMTIVMKGGKFTINGGTVSVSAPASAASAGLAIPGVAVYLPVLYYGPSPSGCGDTNQEIKINGSSLNGFTGSILAPCSDVQLEGGGSSKAFNSQIIGWNVFSSGNADLFVLYDANKQAMRPSTMDMWR